MVELENQTTDSEVSIQKYALLVPVSRYLRFRRINAYIFATLWALAIIAIVSCLVVFGWSKVLSTMTNAADEARKTSIVLEVAVFVGIIFAVVVCAIPGMTMVELTCGFVLGFAEAFTVSVVSIVLASSLSFFIGRHFMKDMFKDYLEERDMHSMQKILKAIERRNGVFLLTMLRLMFVPLFIKNYGPSVIKTRFRDFFIAVCVTTPLYVGLLTYIGSRAKSVVDIATGKASMKEGTFPWYEIVPLVISVLAAACFGWLAYIEFKKLTEEDSSTDHEKEPFVKLTADSLVN